MKVSFGSQDGVSGYFVARSTLLSAIAQCPL
jgi:hypothetical protein